MKERERERERERKEKFNSCEEKKAQEMHALLIYPTNRYNINKNDSSCEKQTNN